MTDLQSESNDTCQNGPFIQVTHQNSRCSPFWCSQQFHDHEKEDCSDDIITLRGYLCSDKVSSPKPGNIGATVGQYIALVHDWSKRNSDGILDNFKIVSIPKGLLLIWMTIIWWLRCSVIKMTYHCFLIWKYHHPTLRPSQRQLTNTIHTLFTCLPESLVKML